MKLTLIVTMLCIAGLVFANPTAGAFFGPRLNSPGLLNMSNMKMNHSMSFSSGFSSQGDGFYQSRYTNHLFYKFSPKLELNVDLSLVNYGTANIDNSFSISGNKDNSTAVIPEFSLNYRPTENTTIRIEYRSMGMNTAHHNRWW